jgi:hypothetical protein
MDSKSLLGVIGIGLLLSIGFGFISGLIRLSEIGFYPFLLFMVTYIPTGILAALWNKETPYSAGYFAGLTISVINLFVTVFVLDINILVSSDSTFNSLILGSGVCLLAAFITVQIAPSFKK